MPLNNGLEIKTRKDAHEAYKILFTVTPPEEIPPVCRHLAKYDLFFLLLHILHRKDIDNAWLFDRCMEVQRRPARYIGLLSITPTVWPLIRAKQTVIFCANMA